MTETAIAVDAVTPSEAYEILRSDPASTLIDVRTRAEWSFVGMPILDGIGKRVWPIEWVSFPEMTPNRSFLAEVDAAVREPGHMLFICRSGARSMMAARAVAQHLAARGQSARCTNVAEGFEGDPDSNGHRGTVNGWKARGLPWAQN